MSSSGTALAVARLVDPRLGLIKRVVRQPKMEGTLRSCVAYSAHVSSTDHFGPRVADRVTGGAALDDEDQARYSAIGEAVERYCGNAVPDDLLTSSFTKLVTAGRHAVDPLELALYSSRQYREPGFPFVPMTRDLEIAWVPGRDLVSGEEELVPAALVYLNYFRGRHAAYPPTNYQILAGIAAGDSLEQAERSALEELLERDATTIWWLSGAPASGIDLADDPLLAYVLADPAASGLIFSFLHIPCTFAAPVVGAFIEDPARTLVAFGTACRATAQAAARKALTEAVVTHRMSLELLDPDGSFWKAVKAGLLDSYPYRPYRQDRAYREEFRHDWRDVHDLSMHVQLYLDPRMHGAPLDRLRAPAIRTQLGALPSVPESDTLDAYLARLAAQGLRALAVDLTTRDVRAAGLRVARVVVPGLYCNAPAAFPLLGGQRLYKEPAVQGWLPQPITEGDLVLHPLPFA